MNVEQALQVVDTIYDATDVEHVLAAEVRRLQAENERLRRDAEIGAAIHRAAAELPRGFLVSVFVERGAAAVVLCDDLGNKDAINEDDNRLAAAIDAAIEAARGEK